MTDLPDAVAAAAHDPLVITLLIFALGGLLTHLLFRKQPLGRAVARVIFLIALTIVLLRAGVVPYEARYLAPTSFQVAVHGTLKIAWWLLAAWFLVGVLRAFVVTEHRPREGKLVQDLLAGVIYLAAVFAIIAYVFDLPIQGLLATSGAIAIILGLALQSTLADVFSGIVLTFSRPYRPGDWISIDGSTDGRVIEMNWRATHVLTVNRDLAIVPNSAIARAKILNASSPSGTHGMTVTIQLDAKTPPGAAGEILERAMLNSRLILATPPSSIIVKSITASSTEFDITFFVEELAQASRAQNELFDLIFRHLAASGVELAATQSQPYSPLQTAASQRAANGPERALNLVEIFATLTAEERQSLAPKLKQRTYDRGETLVDPGMVLHSLFIIGAGVLSVTSVVSEGGIELMRLGPGDHFGEIGLLTGAAATAKISALVPTTVYELTKDDLAPVLEARPPVAQELCRALARRQAAGQLIPSPAIDKTISANRVASWFADRLHRLFDLTSSK
ncbi:mechanosensitive ion channel family protein [Limobrevibacterium gyesilva]|uniref:Small-conductance mechanosensitive channel n=1 Tax=Limobrevibacterium gyesilva TaxID=2991712 RepID=A0AA41YQ71_9PROT|nr:mechanosensitive ion channel family protein [Limobrevibacterium gyesilva]MCW3476263.1 mechanosensitive ion channel family protein [Limobrevibacterium gyesilva]